MNHPLDRIPRWLRLTPAQWAIVIGLALLAAIIGFALQSAKEKTYSSTARVLFETNNIGAIVSEGQNAFGQDGEPASIQATNVALIANSQVAQLVAQKAGLPDSAAQSLLSRVSVGSSGNTNIASVGFSDPNPQLAARLANAWAEQFINWTKTKSSDRIQAAIDALQTRRNELIAASQSTETIDQDIASLSIAKDAQIGDAVQIDTAVPSSSPEQASPSQVALGVGLLQGLLGLCIVAAYRRLRDPIDSSDDLQPLRLPVLADLPRARRLTIARGAPSPEIFESGLRLLLGNMKFVSTSPGATVAAIQSTRPSEGKSSISFHLARVAARSGSSVCLVDADLRYRTITRGVGHPHGPGLSNVLATRGMGGAAELDALLDEALIYVEGFDLLGAGPPPPNPGDLAVRDVVPEIVTALRDRYDLVIIDAPPFLGLPDAARFLQAADGVVIVVRRRAARLYQVRRLVDRLKVLGARPMGTVLNMAAPRDEDLAYGYGDAVPARPGDELDILDEAEDVDGLGEVDDLDEIDDDEPRRNGAEPRRGPSERRRGSRRTPRAPWRR
ncbi:MAG: hypothetical protein AB7V42_05815 [Thermoleophilia bacterium]